MKKRKITAQQIVDFMIVAGKLKWTKRSGWLEKKIPEPETVAEHTYRVTILSRILAPLLGLNPGKLTAMAIFHDLAEGVLGDPITQRGRKVVAKHDVKQESKFMRKVFKELGIPHLFSYWSENILENGPYKTKYSDLLYQIGKIATIWQAWEYELRGVPPQVTAEFWENAEFYVKHPFLKEILVALKKLRRSLKLV